MFARAAPASTSGSVIAGAYPGGTGQHARDAPDQNLKFYALRELAATPALCRIDTIPFTSINIPAPR